VNVQQDGRNSKAPVPLMAVVCNCQADTKSTDGNGYGQPQAVAERSDVAIPCHFGISGQTYKHIYPGRKNYRVDSICMTAVLSLVVSCNDYLWM
jgi:hypothetical protein